MTYTLRRTNLSDNPEDFMFRYFGIDVGRTYAEETPHGPKWKWTIYGLHLRSLPDEIPLQGLADDLEGAKAAFKANWEKLRLAGAVRLELR